MVKVTLSGKGDLKRVTIDPSLMVADDREVLEDLLVAAHADAKAKVEAMMAEEMQQGDRRAEHPRRAARRLQAAVLTADPWRTRTAIEQPRSSACCRGCPASAGAAPGGRRCRC